MRARILKQHGVLQPGQIITAAEGDLPPDVAEYFEDDDPAIITVREPSQTVSHNVAADGEVAPLKGSDFAKSQEAKVKAVAKEHADKVAADAKAVDVAPAEPAKP